MVAVAAGFTKRQRIHSILVACGERHIVRLVQVNLERGGYEVICAFDGKEAQEKAKDSLPDCYIIGDTLIEPDGYSIVKQIRANPETASAPIMMMLRDSSEHAVCRAFAAGADRVTTVPFNATEILALLKM